MRDVGNQPIATRRRGPCRRCRQPSKNHHESGGSANTHARIPRHSPALTEGLSASVTRNMECSASRRHESSRRSRFVTLAIAITSTAELLLELAEYGVARPQVRYCVLRHFGGHGEQLRWSSCWGESSPC